jgi:hypothetical protein
MDKIENSFSYYYKINVRCAIRVQFRLIRMKIETAHSSTAQCCADVHFFVVIRTGVSRLGRFYSGRTTIIIELCSMSFVRKTTHVGNLLFLISFSLSEMVLARWYSTVHAAGSAVSPLG